MPGGGASLPAPALTLPDEQRETPPPLLGPRHMPPELFPPEELPESFVPPEVLPPEVFPAP